MFLNKLKQNLAGFAVVALAFTGLSAIAPANAVASNLADTDQLGFDYTQQFAMTGSNGALTVTNAPSGHIEFNSNWTLTAAGSASLNGHAITADVTATDPNGNIVWSTRGFNRQFINYGGVANSNNTFNWNISTATYIYNVWYTNGSAPMPVGNYTISSVLYKDGVAIVPSSDIAFTASLRYNVVSDTLTWTGTAPSMWRSGYVCVDMGLVSNGDVLTTTMTDNGATIAGTPGIDWTSNGYSTLASGASYTVVSSNIANNTLAVQVDIMGGLTSGHTYGVSIKRGATEVSKSCAPATPSAAPTVSAASGYSTVTFSASVAPQADALFGFTCYLYDANNTLVNWGSAPSSASTCDVYVYGTPSSSSYTMKYAANGLVRGGLSPASLAVSPIVATFDANGGTGTVPSAISHWGSFNAPSGSALTRTGYSFQGWSTNASATSSTIYHGSPVTASANATYYAVWQATGGGGGGGGGGSTLTLVSPAVLTGTGAAGTTISVVPATFTGGVSNKYWVTCTNSYPLPQVGVNLSTAMSSCRPVYMSSAAAAAMSPSNVPTSFVIPGDGMVWTSGTCNQNGCGAPTQLSTSGRYFGWIETGMGGSVNGGMAITVGGSGSIAQSSVVAMPTNIPVVAPIKVPVLGVAPGASLVLAGENMKSLTSVKIGANAATTKTTVAGLEIVVPADLKPGAHDLLIATSTGSTLFVGAIKVADPVIVAAKAAQAKAAASIAYRAPVDLTVAKSVTGSQAAQVKALANQYKNAKTAICEAIPASKSSVASARAAAAKVCATIKAAIPGIKTIVVVGAPSGDKVNRVSSEIQG